MKSYLIVLKQVFFYCVERKKCIKIGAEITHLSNLSSVHFYLFSKCNETKIETTENGAIEFWRHNVITHGIQYGRYRDQY